MAPKDKAARMPYKEAVQTYGEDALKRGPDGRLYSSQRVSNWRREGVPGSVVIHLERTKHNRILAAQQIPSRLVEAARTLGSVPPPVMSVVERVQNIWEFSNQGRGIGWHALEAVVSSLDIKR